MSFTIPNKQKALLVPERFAPWAITEIDIPSPGEGEVLVRSEVVGLNPADWGMQKFDLLKLKYPAILGLEAVGTVVKLGEGVTSLAVGDVMCVHPLFYHKLVPADYTVAARLHPGSNWTGYPTFRQYNIAVAELSSKVSLCVCYLLNMD